MQRKGKQPINYREGCKNRGIKIPGARNSLSICDNRFIIDVAKITHITFIIYKLKSKRALVKLYGCMVGKGASKPAVDDIFITRRQ